MPQISHIKYKEITEARRYDAEYFKPEYLKSDKIIKTKEWKYFDKGIAEITGGNAFNSEGFGKGKIKVAKITEVSQEKDVDQWEAISDEEIASFPKRFLQKGDILFSGTHHNYWDIGKVLFINYEGTDATFNQRVFRIRFKKEINPEFGFILFKTRFLRNQIEKFGRGNNQLNLNFTELNQFKIPILPQSFQLKIEQIVKSAHQKQAQSKQLYREAEDILLKELGLLGYEVKHKLSFFTTKKEIEQAHRYDSEYFQPKYKEIVKKIAKFNPVSLADDRYFKIITGIYSKEYLTEGDNYIRSVNINEDLTIGIEDMYKTREKLDSKFRVKIGDIITSRVGSIGTLGYISEELNNSFISDNILRIRSTYDELNNLFLAFYLKKIGTIFMQRLQRGSVQQRLNQETLKEIKIALIKQSIQKQIAEKIQESHKLRKESKDLLEEAKRKVEEEIEKK